MCGNKEKRKARCPKCYAERWKYLNKSCVGLSLIYSEKHKKLECLDCGFVTNWEDDEDFRLEKFNIPRKTKRNSEIIKFEKKKIKYTDEEKQTILLEKILNQILDERGFKKNRNYKSSKRRRFTNEIKRNQKICKHQNRFQMCCTFNQSLLQKYQFARLIFVLICAIMHRWT
ncbi:hypothetical protein CSB37_02980 [bacterium DOLZORAL124_38_8]|nr:MAG: hypothetical protein CSB37_02980 [bacterium DOLZORAL124_38_8]